MVCNNLYKDPLTGVTNLFGLLECNIENICGENGAVVVVDIIKLSLVNRDYGKQTGDIYIKNVAEIINSTMAQHSDDYGNISAYRYGGDEFLLIFPGKEKVGIRELTNEVNCALKEKMVEYGIEYAGIRTAAWFYNEKITTVNKLLKHSSIVMAKSRTDKEIISEIPEWADDLIEKMLFRVKDTLHLLQEVNTLAMNDEISGLPNHRAATLHLNEVFEEYNVLKKPFTILFIDGDNLKKYNDLGYGCGNKMIRDLSTLITEALRHDDKVFRWLSGDEFVVILRDTSRDLGFKVAERIRSYVEEKTEEWQYPITVSIGIANCPEDGVKLDQIISKSEAANAFAKRTGKNRVV